MLSCPYMTLTASNGTPVQSPDWTGSLAGCDTFCQTSTVPRSVEAANSVSLIQHPSVLPPTVLCALVRTNELRGMGLLPISAGEGEQ